MTIAQYVDDVSFVLVGVHLFMLAISNAMQIIYVSKINHYNVGVIQPCPAGRPELAGSCDISLYSQYIGIT